jgi:hypothetical protein
LQARFYWPFVHWIRLFKTELHWALALLQSIRTLLLSLSINR